MADRGVWIVSAARTAIGSFGGALKDVPLADLATIAVRAALERSGVAPEHVEHVVLGTGGRYALATMCIGGGQGIAAIFERA
jgi:acetyl-CoA acetyltransferase